MQILVADDHEIVRRGLRALLESNAGWNVTEAADGQEVVETAKRLRPDVVVLDVTMPRLSGLEAARRIRAASPASEILILTMHESEQVVREVLAAGARGYLLKSDAGRDLIEAVQTIASHRPYFTSSIASIVLDGYVKAVTGNEGGSLLRNRLSGRELEVVQLLAEGQSNKEVAATLGISVKTAETHRANIMRKLDLKSLSDLVRYAIRNRIIEA